MMVRAEGQVRADQHGRIERREVGGDEIDDALECLSLAEFGERWNAVCHVRVPEEDLVVSEPFVEGTTSDVLVVVPSAEGHPGIEVSTDDGIFIQGDGSKHREDIIVVKGWWEVTTNDSDGGYAEGEEVFRRNGEGKDW
jgi:hypothetical protein